MLTQHVTVKLISITREREFCLFQKWGKTPEKRGIQEDCKPAQSQKYLISVKF